MINYKWIAHFLSICHGFRQLHVSHKVFMGFFSYRGACTGIACICVQVRLALRIRRKTTILTTFPVDNFTVCIVQKNMFLLLLVGCECRIARVGMTPCFKWTTPWATAQGLAAMGDLEDIHSRVPAPKLDCLLTWVNVSILHDRTGCQFF